MGNLTRSILAHSLTCIPPASWRPLSFGCPGLAGPGAGETVWRGCTRGALRRGKVRMGAGREERTPSCPGTGLRCAAGLSHPGRQRARGELETGLASWGFRDQPQRNQRGKSSFAPSEVESVLTRKWLFKSGKLATGFKKPLCCRPGETAG